jgi:hypothetical protein
MSSMFESLKTWYNQPRKSKLKNTDIIEDYGLNFQPEGAELKSKKNITSVYSHTKFLNLKSLNSDLQSYDEKSRRNGLDLPHLSGQLPLTDRLPHKNLSPSGQNVNYIPRNDSVYTYAMSQLKVSVEQEREDSALHHAENLTK